MRHVWHPVTGQVEHCPAAVTPKPAWHELQVDRPEQVTQLGTEHSEQVLLGSMKYPAALSQVMHRKDAELKGAEAAPV